MKHLLALLFVALLFASCKESPTVSDPSVIMPLKVGNQWIGRVTIDSSGTSVFSHFDTITIVKEVIANNETWYETSTGEKYINRADGLWWQTTDGSACNSCQLTRYPAARGDTMMMPEVLVLVPGNNEPVVQRIGREVMATDTSITVEAGTFACYHYKMKIYSPANARFTTPEERFYKPDLGPVGLVYGISGKPARWELMSVTLK